MIDHRWLPQMPIRIAAISALLVLTWGSSLHAQSSNFTVDLSWEGTASCFDPKSPPFLLSGVPTGTKALKFVMKDMDAPSYPHGGGTVVYSGQNQIGRGAFSYKGPCPPQGQHSYQWTVEAQDGTGKTLAVATVTKKFPLQ
jgi:phosphatidylethanolamine-binding protein (PEBP) family uncharacterized protein